MAISFFGGSDPTRPGFFDRPGTTEMMLALGAGLAQAAYPAAGQSGWSQAPNAVLGALQARQLGAQSHMQDALFRQKQLELEQKKARDDAWRSKMMGSLDPTGMFGPTPDEAAGSISGRPVASTPGLPGMSTEQMTALDVLAPEDASKAWASHLLKLAADKGGQETFGNQPIWGTDAQGKPVLMQPSNRGGVKPVTMPPGVTPQRGQTSQVNLGDKIGILDANGSFIGYAPKGLDPSENPDLKGQQAYKAAEGKAMAELNGEAQKKALQGITALNTLEGVEALIDKSTGSYSGAALDAMGALFGHATEGAIASSKLKVLQAGLMLNMPRMEGPQSDRDTNLYREAAGQIGDPTVPGAIKKAAVETIRELQLKYQKAPRAPAPGASTPAPAGATAPIVVPW